MEFGQNAPGAAGPAGDVIKDTTTAGFMKDVIEASKAQPVIVDFWAPWCGPCRQLTPNIEKVVTEKAGKIRLVKVNIDENPGVAGQLGIQSIPAVFAFAGGRPVDAFMGALPESEVRRFADKVIAAAPAPAPREGSLEEEITNAMTAADEAFAAGDLGRAAQVYGMVLQHRPEHAGALVGIARTYLGAGEPERAQQAIDLVPEAERKGEPYTATAAALKLLGEASTLSEAAELEARVATDPNDLQARFDLAVVLNAEGRRTEAADTLIALMRRDRDWQEDGARKKLLELFEAWGPKDPATIKGRRQLSSLLFS